MAFAARPGRGIRGELRRSARSQLQNAIEAAGTKDQPLEERVHEVRTSIKKVRALLRLVAPVMPGADAEEKQIATVARTLSSYRNATVTARLLDELSSGKIPASALVALRARVGDAKIEDEAETLLAEAIPALKASRRGVTAWSLRKRGWAAIEDGLLEGCCGVRDLAEAAFAANSDEAFHDYRKAIKRHLYQMRWLEEVAPSVAGARIEVLDRLADTLGDDHDLVIARTEGRAACDAGEVDRRAIGSFFEALGHREAALRSEAFVQYATVSVIAPRDLVTRLEQDRRALRMSRHRPQAESAAAEPRAR